jgi:hypothetical protein
LSATAPQSLFMGTMRLSAVKGRQSATDEELGMRVFFAFLLGIAVTVGVAFVHDATTPSSGRPFVNWDVVSASARGAIDSVSAQWDRLTK